MPRIATLTSVLDAIGTGIERVRLYRSFVLYAQSHGLPLAARRRLGLED